MKKVGLLLAIGLSLHAFAQTDSTGNTFASATYSSLNTLTRTDIERLPVQSFMELVQGAFPFIGSASFVEREYTFLVDGFVAVNPNAINLSQIERIQFYPAGTAWSRGSLGKKGTFVIQMQPQKSGFLFSAKTGVVHAANTAYGSTTYEYKKGFSTQNELSYQHKTNRGFISSAASFLHLKKPPLQHQNIISHTTFNAQQNRLRLSNVAGLQISRNWQLEGGLFFTSQPLRGKQDTRSQPGTSFEQQNSQRSTLHSSAHAGLRFAPGTKISNRITAEMSYAEAEHKDTAFGSTTIAFNHAARQKDKQRYYAFANHFSWKPVATAAFSIEASLLARYRLTKGSNDGLNTSRSGGFFSQSGWYAGVKSRSFSVSPAVVLHLRQLLTVEGGVTYDDYAHSSKGKETYKKLLPNAGVQLNLASLLSHTGISTLALSAQYQKYQTSYDRIDLLGNSYASNLPQFNPFGAMIYPNLSAAEYAPSDLWVASLAVGWANNRVVLKGSYRMHEAIIMTYNQIYYMNPPAIVFMYEPLKAKNWSVELKTVLLEKQAANWWLTAMVFQDQYERKKWGSQQLVTTPAEALLLDAGKAPLRSGLRTGFTSGRFYLQAAALLNWNELYFEKDGTTRNDKFTYQTNFLLAGYTWPLQLKWATAIDANVQSQNLLHRPALETTRYVGLGLQLRFL